MMWQSCDMNHKNKIAALLTAIGTLILPAGAMAATYTYNITALDLPIGTASIQIDNPGGDYHIGLSGAFTGMVAVFVGAKGNIDINGHQEFNRPAPLHADGTVAWGEKPRRTVVDFDNGTPTKIDVQPPYNYNPKKRVPLDPATLTDVVDPLTAMMRPLLDGKLDCNARPRIFDGHERYDLQFSPTANPMACHAQPINISGYDRKYDESNLPRPLDITFTQIEGEQFAIPSKIVRQLVFGKVLIELVPADFPNK